MKRYGQLSNAITAWANLLVAARKARRGKRRRPVVERFHFRSEWELLELRRQLLDESYRPGPFTVHRIAVPKPRLISAAPYRDRVVHHAIMNLLEPILDRHFHPDSYACRKGKGTHAAAKRIQQYLGQYDLFIACDVWQFFPSIDHAILKTLIRRRFKDAWLLRLLDRIIDSSNEQDDATHYFPGDTLTTPFERRRGLPIGNLTSQWFANLYLDGLDHFITAELGFGAYVRYSDDFVFFGNDRNELQRAFRRIVDHCAGLRLKLHEDRAHVRPSQRGLTFVGFRLWKTHRYLTKNNIRRFRRRVRGLKRLFERGKIGLVDIYRHLQSWIGHALQADSLNLIQRLLPELRWFQDHPDVKTGNFLRRAAHGQEKSEKRKKTKEQKKT